MIHLDDKGPIRGEWKQAEMNQSGRDAFWIWRLRRIALLTILGAERLN